MKKAGIAAVIASAAAALYGVVLCRREAASIGVIGGADGPTAILVAGPTIGYAAIAGMAGGVLLLATGVWLIFRWRK